MSKIQIYVSSQILLQTSLIENNGSSISSTMSKLKIPRVDIDVDTDIGCVYI
jgi:hypothetical protein